MDQMFCDCATVCDYKLYVVDGGNGLQCGQCGKNLRPEHAKTIFKSKR
jgi:hypothetical protein